MSTYDTMLRMVEQATELNNLFLEVNMALGFLRAFIKGKFYDLYGDDICDSYSLFVEVQINKNFLEVLHENLKRKVNI